MQAWFCQKMANLAMNLGFVQDFSERRLLMKMPWKCWVHCQRIVLWAFWPTSRRQGEQVFLPQFGSCFGSLSLRKWTHEEGHMEGPIWFRFTIDIHLLHFTSTLCQSCHGACVRCDSVGGWRISGEGECWRDLESKQLCRDLAAENDEMWMWRMWSFAES